MIKKNIFIIIFLSFCIISCAPMPTKTWTSSPVNQTSQNQYYEAQLELLKKNNNFFEMFRLTVINKSDKNLEIDWNKTRYLYNGRIHGGLVFREIKAKDIKNLTIPYDLIHPGDTFSKEIAPVKLITMAGLRDRSVGKNESGFSPGVIPEGENGIYLVVRYNGKEVSEKLVLTIESKKVQ